MRFLITLLLTLGTAYSFADAKALKKATYSQFVDKAGNITLPRNYRATWTHLGSWLVADPKSPGHGFHDVYMQPLAAEHYRKTKQFLDGAVIIKEVRKVKEGAQTTGLAQWAGETNIWFVMVRDTQGRFKGNADWAEGWGWALFESKSMTSAGMMTDVSGGFETTCKGCHLPAQDTDWVFIDGYPTLTE
jgi:hypothetical protein